MKSATAKWDTSQRLETMRLAETTPVRGVTLRRATIEGERRSSRPARGAEEEPGVGGGEEEEKDVTSDDNDTEALNDTSEEEGRAEVGVLKYKRLTDPPSSPDGVTSSSSSLTLKASRGGFDQSSSEEPP